MERRSEEAPLMRERGAQLVDTCYFESQQRESMKRKGPTCKKVMRERELYEASLSGNVDSLNDVMKEDELILARVCVTCFGETPLHIAAMLGHLEFVIQLVRHKSDLVTQCDSQGFSPLHLASSIGHIEIVKELLMVDSKVCLFCDEDGRTPLHLAVMKGHVEVIKELVRAKPEVIHYKLNRGETLLHSCVKHNRLKALKLLVELGRVDDELTNSKDHDGFTIFHMATALKQLETIKYLLNRSGVKVNAVNGNGFTALDIIEHMPRDLKVMEIRESLLNAGVLRAINLPAANGRNSTAVAPPPDVPPEVEIKRPPSQGDSGKKKHKKSWLEKKRDALMVAATVIAAMAYQAGLNPPGGVWQEDSKEYKDDHPVYSAGESITAYLYPNDYRLFLISNTVSFVASLSIVVLLVSGIPMRRRIFMWILMAAMWVTITFMVLTYLKSLSLILPINVRYTKWTEYIKVMVNSVKVWLGLMGLIFLVHIVRFIIWCVGKVRNHVNKCLSSSATHPQAPGNV